MANPRSIAAAALALLIWPPGASAEKIPAVCAPSGPRVIVAARIGIVAGKTGGRPDNWSDYFVSGRRSDALAVCHSLVKQELEARLPAGLSARLLRRCKAVPLPALSRRTRSEHVLVEKRRRYEAPLLLIAGNPCLAERVGRTEIARWQVMVLASRAECREALATRRAQIKAEAQRGNEAAARWLEQQARRQQTQAKIVCQGADLTASRCKEARDRTERATCQIDLERARRSCTLERRLLGELRRRSREAPRHPPPRVRVRCAPL